MEKETIEEAAENHINNRDKYNRILCGHSFINGAKWQAERSYSEEEVKSILMKTDRFLRADLDIWFEQFKKK